MKTIILSIGVAIAIAIAAGIFLYNYPYLWRSVGGAVVEKNAQPYPAARVHRSTNGIVLVTLEKVAYLYFPETQRIGIPAGNSFVMFGPLVLSKESDPPVFWADDGIIVERKAELRVTSNVIEFTTTDGDRIKVSL